MAEARQANRSVAWRKYFNVLLKKVPGKTTASLRQIFNRPVANIQNRQPKCQPRMRAVPNVAQTGSLLYRRLVTCNRINETIRGLSKEPLLLSYSCMPKWTSVIAVAA